MSYSFGFGIEQYSPKSLLVVLIIPELAFVSSRGLGKIDAWIWDYRPKEVRESYQTPNQPIWPIPPIKSNFFTYPLI